MTIEAIIFVILVMAEICLPPIIGDLTERLFTKTAQYNEFKL